MLNSFRATVLVSLARDRLSNISDIKVFTLGTGESCTFLHGEIVDLVNSYIEPDNQTLLAYLYEKNGPYAYELRILEKVNLCNLKENIKFASIELDELYSKMKKFDY